MSSTGSDEAADATGLIHFETSVSDITNSGVFSSVVEVLELQWKLKLKKVDSSSFLEAYLDYRESDSDLWSIDVSSEFILMNIEKEKNIRHTTKQTFNHENINWGISQFIQWDELINEETGFVTDGKITMEVRFTLSKVVGLRTIPRIDFSDKDEPRHDVALVIEGEKVYVSKQILAVHSDVFKAMFYGDYAGKNQNQNLSVSLSRGRPRKRKRSDPSAEKDKNEIELKDINCKGKDKKEIELKDINRKEFIEMLHFIYPSYAKITDANAEYLLKLGDRFLIKTVIDQCEQFVIHSGKWDIFYKLNLSDQFRLVKLQDHCLDSLKTVQDITNLKTGYKELSKNIKGTLFDKLMKLS